jgi:hypothetical protein
MAVYAAIGIKKPRGLPQRKIKHHAAEAPTQATRHRPSRGAAE